jgi:hypothetical protein
MADDAAFRRDIRRMGAAMKALTKEELEVYALSVATALAHACRRTGMLLHTGYAAHLTPEQYAAACEVGRKIKEGALKLQAAEIAAG